MAIVVALATTPAGRRPDAGFSGGHAAEGLGSVLDTVGQHQKEGFGLFQGAEYRVLYNGVVVAAFPPVTGAVLPACGICRSWFGTFRVLRLGAFGHVSSVVGVVANQPLFYRVASMARWRRAAPHTSAGSPRGLLLPTRAGHRYDQITTHGCVIALRRGSSAGAAKSAAAPSGNRAVPPAPHRRASGRRAKPFATSGQQRRAGQAPRAALQPSGQPGQEQPWPRAEFSDERRLSNPDLVDDRRKSSVRRLSVNEPGRRT